MTDEDAPSLGLCCTCGAAPARNIMMLDLRGPEPGKGWGCALCDLPSDGAIAVLCDECLDFPVVAVCVGYPKDNRRIAKTSLSMATQFIKNGPAAAVSAVAS